MTSRTRWPSARRRATTAPSRSSSRPGPGRGRQPWRTRSLPSDVIAERFDRLKTVIDRSALARHQARVGRSEEVLVEGVSRRDATHAHRAHPPGQARALRSTRCRRTRSGAPLPCHRDRGSSPPPVGPARGGDGAAPPSGAHPGGGRVTAVALVGVTASGKSDVAFELALGRGDCEIVSIDSMCVYRGMDIGTSKAGPEARAAVPHHLLDLVDPDEDFTVTQFQEAARAALGGIAARGHHALLVGGTGLYQRAVVDDLAIPGRYPEVAATFEADLDEGRLDVPELHARLPALDPVGAGRMAPTNRRRVVRALEVTVGSGRPFSAFGPGLEAYPATGRPGRLGRPTRRDRPAHRGTIRHHARGRARRRGAGAGRPPGRDLAHGPPGPRLPRDPRPRRGGRPLADCVDEAVRRTRQFARRQASWFRRDPRIVWADAPPRPRALLEPALSVHG